MSEQPQLDSGAPEQLTPKQRMLNDSMDRERAKNRVPPEEGPTETQRSGFDGNSGADELSPQAEASERSFGAPTETQRSGFDGERRDSGADELSPQAEASERSFGAPTETQRSGFDGERRDSGADELSPQAEASERSLSRRVSRETAPPPVSEEWEAPPPPPEKNQRSPVYVYLAVLFGAAFLMLLLAYFVQQRNNTAAMDDLRTTTNASREELLERINALEEEKDALEEDAARMRAQAGEAEERLKAQEAERERWMSQYTDTALKLERTVILGCLERFCAEEDWLMAACVAEDSDSLFNPRSVHPKIDAVQLPAAQTARYLELRDRLVEEGRLLLYQYSDGGSHTERPVAAQGREVNATQESREAVNAARNLWRILYYYLEDNPEAAAGLTAGFHDPELGPNLEYLNGDTFQPSTIALFEQVRAELLEQGRLAETEDGLRYAENGEPADLPAGEPPLYQPDYDPINQ